MRAPVWILRGVLACVEIVAKAVLFGVRFGAPKVTRFVVLNVSNRIWRYLRSPNEIFLAIDRSRFLVGSRRRLLNAASNVRMLPESCWLLTVLNRLRSNAAPSGWWTSRFRGPP